MIAWHSLRFSLRRRLAAWEEVAAVVGRTLDPQRVPRGRIASGVNAIPSVVETKTELTPLVFENTQNPLGNEGRRVSWWPWIAERVRENPVLFAQYRGGSKKGMDEAIQNG
jgi:hypothetical protein